MHAALRFAWLATALLGLPAPAQPPSPQPETILPDRIWPADAETVDFAALQALPDWRGLWAPILRGNPPNSIPLLKGRYKTHYDEIQALIRSGDPEAQLKVERRASACEPPGMPGIMSQPYNFEVIFSPGRVTIVEEAYMQVRRIYTDGRPLPEDPDPTYNGASIGRWEGDTLVVETIGLREGGTMARWGITHSDKVKLIERIHLDPADKDVLVIENRFEDPLALSAPWTTTTRFARQRGLEQIEFVCAQNDRNPIDSKGEVQFLGVGR